MTAPGETAHPPADDAIGASRHRLPPQPGECIDRTRPIQFRFEGRTYYGFTGDTISSALAANGVRLLGRSFKYHRPRGIYSLANHDVNVLVSEGTRTNIRADVTPIWESAEFTAVNTFGGLQNDLARRFDQLGRFLPVGFYYKTFHKPRRLFPFWERQMRAMAGLGAVDPKAPRLRTAKQYEWCDVLVVGGGPSGLSAAIAAAEQGLQVIVVDEQPLAGGSLLYQGSDRLAVLQTLLDRARDLSNLTVRTATVAAGYYADHWVALVDQHRMTKLRAKSVVFATGALEQPALFRNNDLPGVMLATAAQRLIRLYAVRPFDRPIVLAANADGYRAALDLQQLGIGVRMIVDLRPDGEPTDIRQQVLKAGIVVRPGHCVYEASSASDATGIDAVTICPIDGDGQPQVKRGERIECDGLVMSVGWAPADSLFCQAGGKMNYSRELEQFVPDLVPPGIFITGRLRGVFALDVQLTDGRRAGLAATAYLGRYSGPLPEVAVTHATPPSHPWPVVEHPAGKVFVDLDEDVQLKDIKHAVQEGFDNVELLKRYSTFGMGPSQGKIANTNTIRVLADLRGESMGETGSPTARPFFHPVPLSHLAGKGFHPHRETALHSRHEAAGARFIPAGDWLRPAYYASNNVDRHQAIAAEVAAVRQRAGLIDVSTLGKLEITGPDAAQFLERIYTGRFAKMKVGTTRYGLMCDESGVIIDDGVIGRLTDDRFYVTTTTTASGSVYREMQRWAIVWKLNVVLANLTGAMAAMNLAGPQAPAVLAELTDLDLSDAGFPYLGLREAAVLGVPARVLRTGFVGEVGYEIHVPAQSAARVWDGILQAGASRGIVPFGVEAQRLLRLEKGHVIVSQDTDGLTTPYEAGMEWAVKHDKPFFVGGRSLKIVAHKPLKRRLIGFTLPRGYNGPLPAECHLVIEKGAIVGRVTSIADSGTVGRAIGLAYVAPQQAAPGTEFQIRVEGGKMVAATVVELPFYDRTNARQRVAAEGWKKRACERRPTVSEPSAREEASGARRQASGRSDEASKLELRDVSELARIVIKGPAAADLLRQHGIGVPMRVYQFQSLADDGLVVRTGATEFFIEDSWQSSVVARLRAAFKAHLPGVLPVWRQDLSLLISGSEATTLLAQVASCNFRDSGETFVMTQLASVSCSVLARPRQGLPTWQIWADGTYGPYLWETLTAIAASAARIDADSLVD
ncbi:MAG TPA: glycine cleavage T C-terminal barrel domain-containing protein [Pirellulales bacterium]|nr:glycine cleavage T C-terminal barrel domain-containing protein [Pirellulales bacterium]